LLRVLSSPQHQRTSPPPSGLSCISEEQWPQTVSGRVPLCRPQISITDERGATAAPPPDEGTTPLLLGVVEPEAWGPSITRGIGRGPVVPPEGELQKTSSGSFEVSVSGGCTEGVLEAVKEQLVARGSVVGAGVGGGALALHGPGGLQVEVSVSGRGLRVRRISGDQLQYHQLCHELLACIRVV
jgi:hypothetical protein